MLIQFVRRHPARLWPLLAVSVALLLGGLFVLAQGA